MKMTKDARVSMRVRRDGGHNLSSTIFLPKAFVFGGRRLRARRLSRRVGMVVYFAIVLLLDVGVGGAQQNETTDGVPMFVSSVDADSPVFFSSVDAARRNRPPQPAKTREDLFYPDGFLSLSSPSVEKTEKTETLKEVREEKIVAEEKEVLSEVVPIRPLDPSVETTPSAIPIIEEKKKVKEDNVFFLALSVALASLGVFLYYDFRYRNQLREDLVQNARLCSSRAVAADFEAVLARGPELTDPREPSYINPTFDPESLAFDDRKVNVNPDEERFNVSETGSSAAGPDIDEENFDFVPKERSAVDSVNEPYEDFVVGESGVGR